MPLTRASLLRIASDYAEVRSSPAPVLGVRGAVDLRIDSSSAGLLWLYEEMLLLAPVSPLKAAIPAEERENSDGV
jgi:hypothetical protein